MPTTPVLNPQVVQELVDSLEAPFVIELVNTFLEDSPHLVDQIHQGIRNNETEQVHRAAHTLKSLSNTFGLEQLGPLCQELEKLSAHDELPEGTKSAAQDTETAYRNARQALADFRQELAPVTAHSSRPRES
ncbi:Hpt domain-containing protein [Streptomyces tubercidicus]|uniref:Hpt domain-containing protein n=1 Tax=Streptomyces tubercidicus TaxID=47759 RepID=UPI0036BB7B51